MDVSALRKIGLTSGETKIYDFLLSSGHCSINTIQEGVGIERRHIYDILNKLIERGLVTYIKENKHRLFQTTPPTTILKYIEEKETELKKSKNEIEKSLPSHIKQYNLKKLETNGEISRGPEGTKALWEESLNYSEVYWIGSGRYVINKYSDWFTYLNKKRIKAKSKWFNLLRSEMRGKTKQMALEEIKYLPPEFSQNPVVICIYGNKVVNYLFGKEYFAFIIENKELAENYKAYHKYLWDNVAKK